MVLTGGLLATSMVFEIVFAEARAVWVRVPHPRTLLRGAAEGLAARLRQGADLRRNGRRMVLVLGGGAVALGLAISQLPGALLWQVLLASVLLSHRSLIDALRDVANAFPEGLGAARGALAGLGEPASGDLDASGVAGAAIERAATGFMTGVAAPGFWFLIAGLPGILAYTAVRVADETTGRGVGDTEGFGHSASRICTLMERIPAWLAVALLSLAAGRPAPFLVARREGAQLAARNTGRVTAALGAALGIRLGGPRRESDRVVDAPWLNADAPRTAAPADIATAIGVLWRAWVGLLALALFVWVAI